MRVVFPILFAVCLLAHAWPASAQSLGTFRWQLQPFCNVLTLAVTQIGSQYRFEGSDDQCGAATRAAVTGLGVANADGTIEFGLTIVGANGPQHVDVTFSIGPLGGPWRDGSGTTGSLVFLPSGAGSGPPRPAPAPADGSITTAKIATSAVDSSKILDGSVAGGDINAAEVQRRITGGCGAGQYVQSVGADGSVACGTDGSSGGTITAVTAGTGLTGGGTSGSVALAVNAAVVQSRVTGTCGPGLYVQTVAANGAVTCGADATLAVAGTGAAGTAARTDHTHAAAGTNNFAVGPSTLAALTTGQHNTAVGTQALMANTNGGANVAIGVRALDANTSGALNIAIGRDALGANLVGNGNIAIGDMTLASNSTSGNIAIGSAALQNTTVGPDNLAMGEEAMVNNQTGQNNVALGRQAIRNPINASFNVAVGESAMWQAGNGSNNVAVGPYALLTVSGNSNIGIGNAGGQNLALSNNIAIGHLGDSLDSGVIRMGTPGQHTSAFVAGIAGVNVANQATVVIDISTGQLGAVASSGRLKERVRPLDETARLQALRPVSFLYKPEYDSGAREPQYGLIAEEVAETMPELVVRDAEGRPATVRYHLLPPLLLAEVQRLERERMATQRTHADEIDGLRAELAALRALIERR